MLDASVLRTLIDNRDIKQAQLARKTGIGRNSICRYLSGEVQPSSKKLRLIADALGVPMESLLVKDTATITPIQPPKRRLCFCPNCGVNLMGVSE